MKAHGSLTVIMASVDHGAHTPRRTRPTGSPPPPMARAILRPMAELTPGALVDLLRAGMASGAMPPLGTTMASHEAIEQLARELEPLVAADFTCSMVGAPGVENTYRGLHGVRAGWADWSEAFSRLTIVFEDLVETRAGALLLARQRGATRHEDVPIEQRSAVLMRVRGGELAAVEFYLDHRQAQRAAAA
jgi:ketosteroid isomerase-like protein